MAAADRDQPPLASRRSTADIRACRSCRSRLSVGRARIDRIHEAARGGDVRPRLTGRPSAIALSARPTSRRSVMVPPKLGRAAASSIVPGSRSPRGCAGGCGVSALQLLALQIAPDPVEIALDARLLWRQSTPLGPG